MRGVCLRRETCPAHTVQWYLLPGAPRLPCLALLSLCPSSFQHYYHSLGLYLLFTVCLRLLGWKLYKGRGFCRFFSLINTLQLCLALSRYSIKCVYQVKQLSFYFSFSKWIIFFMHMKIMYVHYWGKMTILKSIKQRKYIALYPTMTALLKFWWLSFKNFFIAHVHKHMIHISYMYFKVRLYLFCIMLLL